MRKHLQFVLMAPVIAAFLSLTPGVRAEAGADNAVITSTTDNDGRTVYVNESLPVASKRSQTPIRQSSLVFWSATEHRWKPVPSANVRAARSAAEEVNHLSGVDRRACSGCAPDSRPGLLAAGDRRRH